MKKKAFIFAIAAIVAFGSCDKDNGPEKSQDKLPPLPDETNICSGIENEIFRNFCLDRFDIDKDGKISPEEAALVTEINFDIETDEDIESFNGIGYFVNLESLICPEAYVNSIDLHYNTKITEIADSAFEDCCMESFVFPPNVKVIGEDAFADCTGLTEINLPEGLETIKTTAFFNCGFTEVKIPDSVTTIGDGAFSDCSDLKSFDGKFASEDKRCLIQDGRLLTFAPAELTEYTIPEGVTAIGGWAFVEAMDLTKVTFPDGLESIGPDAFSHCGLTTLELPETLKTIGDNSFIDNRNVQTIKIPDSVTTLGQGVFINCRGLESITIGKGITKIPYETFYGCLKLSKVNFASDNNITSIEAEAFYQCHALAEITLPVKVTKIEADAFKECFNLKNLTIGGAIQTIGTHAFDTCTALETITVSAPTPPVIGDDIFYNTPSTLKIYVPMTSVNLYKVANGWSTYAEQINGIYYF